MASIVWDRELAEVYDQTYRAQFAPSVLSPMVDLLAGLARAGPALEFAVGTGRIALPLSARGIAVHGLELSPHMAAQLSAKPGADAVPVTIGDMTATRVPGAPFTLVYLVANTIMNVTTQDDQLAVFANAASHLEPGGHFVVEVIIPQLRRVPPGEIARVFTLGRADRVVASLDRSRRPPGAPLRALPVHLAVRARPDGQDRRIPAQGPLGELGPCALHVSQPEPGRGVRENGRDLTV